MVSKYGLMTLTVVLTLLVITIVPARLWARREKRLKLWADDICAIIAAGLFIVVWTVPVIISCIVDNLGDHVLLTTSGEPKPPSRTFNITHFTYLTFHVLPLGFAKCSILLLYRRIFIGKLFSTINWAVIGLVIAWMISFFLTFLLQCIPVEVSSVHAPGWNCINIVPVTWALGISGVITDFIIMVMPWHFVWKLQMPIRQKLAVIGIFLLGALCVNEILLASMDALTVPLAFRTIAASLTRCVILFAVGRGIDRGDLDYTYYDGENMVWALTECALAIISSCLPTMGRFLRGWSLKVNLWAWTRSFRSKYAAGTHGIDEHEGSGSYIHLRAQNTAELRPDAFNTSTVITHDQEGKHFESDLPPKGIVTLDTFTIERADDKV